MSTIAFSLPPVPNPVNSGEPAHLSEFNHIDGQNRTADFRETWGLDLAPKCGTGKKVFRHTRNIGRYKLVTLFCGRWDCPACGPKLASAWAQHLEAKFREAAAQGDHLYLIVADPAAWPAVQKELARQKARYARFATAPLKVIATAPAAAKGAVAVQLQPDRAVELAKTLCSAVQRCGAGSRRITTSRNWAMRRRPKLAEEWEEVGVTQAGWETVRRVVEGMGGELSVHNEGSLSERGEIVFPWKRMADEWLALCDQKFLKALGIAIAEATTRAG
jgi:hypothetical protein